MAETKYAPKGELVEIRYLIHELYNSSFSRAEKQMKVVTENDMTTDLVAELSQCDEQFNDLLVKYKDCKHRLQTKLRYSDEEMAMIIKTIGRSVIPYSFFCEVDGTTRSFLPNQLEQLIGIFFYVGTRNSVIKAVNANDTFKQNFVTQKL